MEIIIFFSKSFFPVVFGVIFITRESLEGSQTEIILFIRKAACLITKSCEKIMYARFCIKAL